MTGPARVGGASGRGMAASGRRGVGRSLRACALATAPLILFLPGGVAAQTEVHLQVGSHLNPFADTTDGTVVVTLQHAAQWSWGDHFVFADVTSDGGTDGFNELDLYGEWYPTLSLGKIFGSRVGLGPVRDVAVLGGVNFGAQAKLLKYTPGLRASWDIPGFIFVNTDFARLVDASTGIVENSVGENVGGAPSTSDGWMFDVNWLAEWEMLGLTWTFTGHAEYISAVTNQFGSRDNAWILAQPQIAVDIGRLAGGPGGNLLTGIEWQFWHNKLGTDQAENTVQFLLVWRL